MQSILKIGDMTIKYQYHFNDYFKDSIKQYEIDSNTYDYAIYVELTESYEKYDLDWHMSKNRYHFISDSLEVVTVYQHVEQKIYSQQIVFNKEEKIAYIRLNPKYVKDLAMQEYVLSGVIFLEMAVMHGFISLHASAISYMDEAILFSAPSQTGKSTQAKLWQAFDESVEVINDDKPLLYQNNGQFYIIGTPFSGKTAENKNKAVPLKSILFLKQGKINHHNVLSHKDMVKLILINAMKPKNKDSYEALLSRIEKLIDTIPIYEFIAIKDPSAVTYIHQLLYKEPKK